MILNRRSFLRTLLGATAAVAVAPALRLLPKVRSYGTASVIRWEDGLWQSYRITRAYQPVNPQKLIPVLYRRTASGRGRSRFALTEAKPFPEHLLEARA